MRGELDALTESETATLADQSLAYDDVLRERGHHLVALARVG